MKDFLDFDWYYYVSKKYLNFDENEFWKSTPRKFNALLELYMKYEIGESEEDEVVSIDSLDL